jgi:outer membrane protein assembly factor BamE (lipoprotein component of BamABCDE complex)
METYLRKGMTMEEVLEFMGPTSDIGNHGPIWYYVLHANSVTDIIFGKDDTIVDVRHIGT